MALTDDRTDSTGADRPARKGWLAAGGVLGAFLASACCIGPLVLLTLGISGAWIGNLTALEPYKPIFAVIASASSGRVSGRSISASRPSANPAPTAQGQHRRASPRARSGPRSFSLSLHSPSTGGPRFSTDPERTPA